MSAADESRELHSSGSAHALHGYVQHSRKMREQRAIDARQAYFAQLEDFARAPKLDKLEKLFTGKYSAAGYDIDLIQFAAVADILHEKLVGALRNGNQEEYEKWHRAIAKHHGGKQVHPLTDVLLEKLDDNDPVDSIAESMLRTKPEMEVRRRIKELAKGGEAAQAQYGDTSARLALLTAVAAHAPQILASKGKRVDLSGLHAVRAALLGTTASGDVGCIAVRLVGQNDLGRALRQGFRAGTEDISAPVWQKVIDHAQQGHVPTNIIEALPAAIGEVIGMTFGRGNYRALNRDKYFADETRDFLRRTKPDAVLPAQVADVANSLAAAEQVRQDDVAEIKGKLDGQVEPLVAKKDKGLRVALASLPLGLNKPFIGLAEGRARRIDAQINRLYTQAELAEEAARSKAMDARAHELKQAVRLAASLTMLHKGKGRNHAESPQLAGFRNNLYIVVQTGLAQANPVETPRFLAQVANVIGGIRRDVRKPLGEAATYQPIMDKPQTPHSHAVNLLALASGIQRAPEALTGYMLALNAKGELQNTINYMAEETVKGERVYAADMGLFAQALGDAARRQRDEKLDGGAIELVQFHELLVGNVLNDRFQHGHVKGMSDLTRAEEAGRKLLRSPKALKRAFDKLRPARPAEQNLAQTDMQGNTATPV